MSSANPRLGAQEARALLGLAGPVDDQTLRLAFRAAVKAAHPDRPGGDSERLRQVIEAYQFLRGRTPSPAGRPVGPAPRPRPRMTITPADAMIGGWRTVLIDGAAARVHLPAGLREGEPMSIDGRTMVVAITGGETAVLGDHLCLTARVEPGVLLRGGRLIIDTPVGAQSLWLTAQDGVRGLIRVAGQGLPARAGCQRGDLFIRLLATPGARSETEAEEKRRRFTAAWAA